MTTLAEIPLHELPDWMRQARRGIDWGMMLVFAFSLVIGMPFITQESLPHTNASENYVYRTADYAAALIEGRLYPRWSPNAFGGYGAPIPHYEPPGAAYVAAVIQVLFTADPILAVRIVFMLALSLAGVMIYLFTMQRVGGGAGLLAALLYVYSPYVGLTAPHLLGDLPGVLSFALMPMQLWSINRLIRRRLRLDILLISVTTAALYLTSPSEAFVSTFIVAILAIWHRRSNGRVPWLHLVGGYILGLGIAGFYWIPALLEQEFIHWRMPFISSNFSLTLAALFTLPHQIDLGELIPTPQFSLGMAGIGFTAAGLVSAVYFRRQNQFQLFFLIMGIGLTAGAVIFLPNETWLLGGIMLCLSIGGSVVLRWRETLAPRWRRIFLPTLLIIIWITAAPVWLPPPVSDPFGNSDGKTQVQYEIQGYGIAVMPPDQPIPSTLPDDTVPNRFLIEGYQSDNINKISPGQLNANIQVGSLEHDTHSDRFQIRSNAPFTLTLLTAFFPGWRASVSDQVIPLRPDPDTQLIHIDTPSIQTGELHVTLGTTLVRVGAWIISWACLLIVLIATWRRWRRYVSHYDEVDQISYQEVRLLSVVLVSFAVIIFLFNSPGFPFSLRLRSNNGLQNSTFIQNRTDTGLSLVAFRLERNQYLPGDHVSLNLFWQTQRFLPENYQVQVYLANNRDGSQWSSSHLHHPGNYPTRRWKTGLYVTDSYDLPLPLNITPGNYQINVEVYTCNPDCTSDGQATFFNNNGEILGTKLTLPTLLAVSS
jgi:hypothetical protein